MRSSSLSLRLLSCLFLALPAYAQRTLHVPADLPTVQSGIDAAASGDTILVAPGTYAENLDFHGKAITLQSAEGPATTILDGRYLAPVVSFVNGETRASTLTGFTLRNGAPDGSIPESHGAGILLRSASPTIIGNILTSNRCTSLDATQSAPLFTNNLVTHTLPDAKCLAQAIAPLVFTGDANDPTLLPTVFGNTVEHNDLTGTMVEPNAGAIALLAARAILQNNILRLNTVPGEAPAAIQVLAQPTIAGTIATLIEQNLIYANTTQCGAGGLSVTILNDGSTPVPHLEIQVLNNTIADNLSDPACPADSQAAEVALGAGSLPEQILLANNIFAASTEHPPLQCFVTLPPASMHHNLLHNTVGPLLSATCPDSGANQMLDPQFLDRAQADYHPVLHSPAVDSGSNTVSPMAPRDLAARPRLQNATGQPTAIVDLGAFEFPAPHHVYATTTVLNVTPSPSEAFQTITLSAQVTSPQSGIPVGSITFTASSSPSLPSITAIQPLDASGRASITTSALPAGSYTLTAAFNGSDTLAASTSAPMLQTIHPATTILAFSIEPSSAVQSQAVSFSAHATAPLSTQAPTGTVQFLDLSSDPASPILIGATPLDATGTAVLTPFGMAAGTHRITAVYLGTPNFLPVSLPAADALTFTIATSDYIQTLSAATMTLVSSHHAPMGVTLTSVGSFADTLDLSCTDLPIDASCTFAPATAILTAGSSAAMTVTLDTDIVHGFARLTQPGTPRASTVALAGCLPMGLLALLCLCPAARRPRHLGLLALLFAILPISGCGAGQYPAHTPAGTYQIHIVSQSPATGATKSTPFTLVVTP